MNGANYIMRFFIITLIRTQTRIVMLIKSRRMEYAGPVAEGVMGNAYTSLFGKNGRERLNGGERCVDGIIILNWTGCEMWTGLHFFSPRQAQ
jgi:hypothetical protein